MRNAIMILLLLVGLFILVKYVNKQTPSQPPLQTQPKHSLVLFHAPWCGYCKQFMPEWQQIQNALNGHPMIQTIAVNGDENKPLMDKYQVPGFPTILLELNTGEVVPYDGDRTAQAILTFVNSIQ